jgi:hypothetical protein
MPDPVDPLDDELDELDDDVEPEDDDDDTAPRGKKSPVRPSDYDRAMGAELRQLLETHRYSYRSFADAIRAADEDETWTKSRIQRLANATRRFSLTELADILATLGEPRERFLARVGYIKLPNDLESWVRVDVACGLNEGDRDSIQAIIDRAKKRGGAELPAPSPPSERPRLVSTHMQPTSVDEKQVVDAYLENPNATHLSLSQAFGISPPEVGEILARALRESHQRLREKLGLDGV